MTKNFKLIWFNISNFKGMYNFRKKLTCHKIKYAFLSSFDRILINKQNLYKKKFYGEIY